MLLGGIYENILIIFDIDFSFISFFREFFRKFEKYNKKIKAFGIELGSQLEKTKILSISKAENEEKLYRIKPIEKSKYLNMYHVIITPITKKIYFFMGK